MKPSNYNYEDFIKIKKGDNENNNHKKEQLLDKLYLTNNIVESINGKIQYYLPKKTTDNISFVNTLTKILINSEFTHKKIIRHDYITRSLLLMIDKLNLNSNLKWVTYEEFIK